MLCIAICVLSLISSAVAQGQWSAVQSLPYIPVHASVMPNGQVFIFSYYADSLYPQIWDPATGSVSAAAQAPYELFCAGHNFLADGRLFITGGHIADYVGYAHAVIYDPQQNTYTSVPDMNEGRWYPTNTILPNGDVLVVSGDMTSNTTPDPLPQVYQVATNTWRDLTTAQLQQPLYPVMLLAPNGNIFNAGPLQGSLWLDTSGTGSWSQGPGMNFNGSRDYGPGLFYESGKVMEVGGSIPPTATAEIIDLNSSNPQWVMTGSMNYPRRQHNAVVLPDGRVFVSGGSSGAAFDDSTNPVYQTEMWDPATGQWTVMASMAPIYRGYHSVAFLLPDGRVFAGGGNVGGPNYQVYSPDYLSAGPRPTISAAPTAAGYGQTLLITTPDAATISKVSLIRLPAVTHTYNQNARFMTLQFTQGTGGVNVTFPANANLAPPGHYMLFLVNSSGVPSVATILQISTSVPATGTINGSVTNTAGSPLGGVQVSGGGVQASTLGNGSYTLTGLTPGPVVLTGYTNVTQTVTVQADAAVTASAMQLAPNASGSISGSVIDGSGHGIAGATVSASGQTATTGSGGAFTLNNVPAGTVTLTASAAGYQGASETVTVNAGAAASAQPLQLIGNDGNVSGVVTNASGSPISGATVAFGGGTTTTNSSGAFAINNIPVGTIQLVASANGCVNQQQNVSITAGATATANFTLSAAAGSVSGTVVSSAGSPISGATVSYGGGSTTTSANGTFTLNNIPAGGIQLTASANSYVSQQQNVSITAGATATANFTLSAAAGSVSGAVVSSAGSPISGAAVSYGGGSTTTSANGTFTLNNIQVGTIQLAASASGFASQTESVNITAGATASANFTLAAIGFGLSNSGNLTLAAGQNSGNTAKITVTPLGGFTGQVNLTCAVSTSVANPTAPPTCTGVGPAITIGSSGAVVVTATINTTPAAVGALAPLRLPWTSGGIFAVLIFAGLPRRRRGWSLLTAMCIIALVLFGVSCGTGTGAGPANSAHSTAGTTPGTYTVTVSGVDATGKITANTSFSVQVN